MAKDRLRFTMTLPLTRAAIDELGRVEALARWLKRATTTVEKVPADHAAKAKAIDDVHDKKVEDLLKRAKVEKAEDLQEPNDVGELSAIETERQAEQRAAGPALVLEVVIPKDTDRQTFKDYLGPILAAPMMPGIPGESITIEEV